MDLRRYFHHGDTLRRGICHVLRLKFFEIKDITAAVIKVIFQVFNPFTKTNKY